MIGIGRRNAQISAVHLLWRGDGQFNCRVVVKTLCFELLSKSVFHSRGFFQFGSFVLKPNLNLGFAQVQLFSNGNSSTFSKVLIRFKLLFQYRQLFSFKSGSGPLVVCIQSTVTHGTEGDFGSDSAGSGSC